MSTVSGQWRLEADKEGRGRFCVIGNPQGMPAGSGLLAIRRIGDDHWLTGSGLWFSGRPQWFPFRRDASIPGETWIEVTAVAVLDLIASPPTDPLSARLRFAASAEHDVLAFDIELMLSSVAGASQGDALPDEGSGEHISVMGPVDDDGAATEVEATASVQVQTPVVPRDRETASVDVSQTPPTEQQPDPFLRPRLDRTERESTTAATGSASAEGVDTSVTDAAPGTQPATPTVPPTSEVDIPSEPDEGPPEPDVQADAVQDADVAALEIHLLVDAPVAIPAGLPVAWGPDPATDIDEHDLPVPIRAQGFAEPELAGATEEADDVKPDDRASTSAQDWRQVNLSRVGVSPTEKRVPRAIEVSDLQDDDKDPIQRYHCKVANGAARGGPDVLTEAPESGLARKIRGSRWVAILSIVILIGTGAVVGSYFWIDDSRSKPIPLVLPKRISQEEAPAPGRLDCARTPNHSDCPPPDDDTASPGDYATRQQIETYFEVPAEQISQEESPTQDRLDCARTPDRTNCPPPGDDPKPPGADTAPPPIDMYFK